MSSLKFVERELAIAIVVVLLHHLLRTEVICYAQRGQTIRRPVKYSAAGTENPSDLENMWDELFIELAAVDRLDHVDHLVFIDITTAILVDELEGKFK